MAYVEVFCRCLIGLVFLLSAYSKLPVAGRFGEFAASLAAMRLLPARAVRPVAAFVVVAEAAVPVLLLVPLPVRALTLAGFAVAGALLVGFAGAIVLVLRRGTPASCRCFGGSKAAPFRWHHVVRNAVLVAVAGAGAAAVAAAPSVEWPVVLVAAPAAVVVAVLVSRLDDVVDLFAPLPAPTGRRGPARNT